MVIETTIVTVSLGAQPKEERAHKEYIGPILVDTP
jgi:hypothetical protein